MFMGGEIELNTKELDEYLWVTKAELKEYLSPDLAALCETMLVPF